MAKFVEVMVQARRMCDKCGENCFMCPLNNTGDCILMLDNDNACDTDYAKIEDIIMQWAAEHPEPVYPSWKEAWKRLFPDGWSVPCAACFGEKYRDPNCDNIVCAKCWDKPIPAEVAKKLGIKLEEESE